MGVTTFHSAVGGVASCQLFGPGCVPRGSDSTRPTWRLCLTIRQSREYPAGRPQPCNRSFLPTVSRHFPILNVVFPPQPSHRVPPSSVAPSAIWSDLSLIFAALTAGNCDQRGYRPWLNRGSRFPEPISVSNRSTTEVGCLRGLNSVQALGSIYAFSRGCRSISDSHSSSFARRIAEIIQPSRDRTDHQVQCSKACGGRRIRGFSIRYH